MALRLVRDLASGDSWTGGPVHRAPKTMNTAPLLGASVSLEDLGRKCMCAESSKGVLSKAVDTCRWGRHARRAAPGWRPGPDNTRPAEKHLPRPAPRGGRCCWRLRTGFQLTAPTPCELELPPTALGLGSCRQLSAVTTQKVVTGRPRPEGFPLLALCPQWVDSPDRQKMGTLRDSPDTQHPGVPPSGSQPAWLCSHSPVNGVIIRSIDFRVTEFLSFNVELIPCPTVSVASKPQM